MTTADWLRAKIGPAPYPAAPDGKHLQPGVLRFFTQYLRPDMRVLHAYSGDGASTLSMSEHVLTGEVVGVDPDMDNVRAARRRSVAPDGAEITFERGALGRLPFGPEEFDAVLLGGSLSSVDSPERALEEVQGVLVPGGLLGVRHTVASSRVFSGKSRLLERSLDRQETILRDLGLTSACGNPTSCVRTASSTCASHPRPSSRPKMNCWLLFHAKDSFPRTMVKVSMTAAR